MYLLIISLCLLDYDWIRMYWITDWLHFYKNDIYMYVYKI